MRQAQHCITRKENPAALVGACGVRSQVWDGPKVASIARFIKRQAVFPHPFVETDGHASALPIDIE